MTTTTETVEGNLADGCGTEHDPHSNLGCALITPTIGEPIEPTPVVEPDGIPDMSAAIRDELVQGVRRYREIAADALKANEAHRETIARNERDAREYEGKAVALAAFARRAGIDPDTGLDLPPL